MEEIPNSLWLREAMRISITASVTDNSGLPAPTDPRFRKLLQGILYSRKFILTYHLVILGFIAIVAAAHWSDKAIKWRQMRMRTLRTLGDGRVYDEDAVENNRQLTADEISYTEASSSGSSTLEGTASPPADIIVLNEDTPLVRDAQPLKHLYLRRPLHSRIKAILMYQPAPIPVINKVLPTIGTIIVIGAFYGLNTFYTIFNLNFTILELFVAADRCGLVFVANLPLLYLLAAKTQPLRALTGYSYESLNIFHRRLGELLCLEALLHATGMFGVWYTLLRPNGSSLVNFLLHRVITLGLGAFIAYELLYFTSLASFRQRCYEIFLGLHVALQTAALVFLFFHHHGSRIYVSIALGVFLADRLLYRIFFRVVTVPAEVCILEDQKTVRISAMVKLQRSNTLRSLIGTTTISNGWRATDHVFLTIPSLGRKYIIQAHPFTIASPAPLEFDGHAKLDLLIRCQEGFSADLIKFTAQRKSLMVRLDGPYGSSHARDLLQHSDIALIIAGGSGIAVAWPLVHFLLGQSRQGDVEILPANREDRQKIFLIWVVHKNSHISWIGQPALHDIKNRGAAVILPRATEEVGRPDLKAVIHDLVVKYGGGKRIGVVGSGPDSMNRVVRNACSRQMRDGRDVSVAIEKFGW